VPEVTTLLGTVSENCFTARRVDEKSKNVNYKTERNLAGSDFACEP
jgi:hypothetical protein